MHHPPPKTRRRRSRAVSSAAGAQRVRSAPFELEETDLLLPPAVRVYLAPGRLYASAEAVQVTTILGSCVSVCLWDAQQRVGGINHFLLPEGVPPSPRFGASATSLLIEEVLALGARRSRLRAKVFGGACVLEAFRKSHPLGMRNVEVARCRRGPHGSGPSRPEADERESPEE
ncbi:MAG: hypothetical protein DMF79_14935 [Acidobacteria bacterium]|nr:MAG: hypothetical protein DMF79_14935 [Acidobacteriota bacterium]